jgi:hypothetical protein
MRREDRTDHHNLYETLIPEFTELLDHGIARSGWLRPAVGMDLPPLVRIEGSLAVDPEHDRSGVYLVSVRG